MQGCMTYVDSSQAGLTVGCKAAPEAPVGNRALEELSSVYDG